MQAVAKMPRRRVVVGVLTLEKLVEMFLLDECWAARAEHGHAEEAGPAARSRITRTC
jgi:hypothetical protein